MNDSIDTWIKENSNKWQTIEKPLNVSINILPKYDNNIIVPKNDNTTRFVIHFLFQNVCMVKNVCAARTIKPHTRQKLQIKWINVSKTKMKI